MNGLETYIILSMCVCVCVCARINIYNNIVMRIYCYNINDALCLYNNDLWRAPVPYMATTANQSRSILIHVCPYDNITIIIWV